MDEAMTALLLATAVGAVSGALVPRLVATVPEPEPQVVPEPAVPETSGDASGAPGPDTAGAPGPAEADSKPRYADLASRAGLLPGAVLLGAGVGALIALGSGWDPRLVGWLVGLPWLLALGFIDWHTKLLPNHLMWPCLGLLTVAVPASTWWAGQVADEAGSVPGLLFVLGGAAGCWVFYLVLWVVNGSGIGFGDVRLAWGIGLLLASVGWGGLLVGVWLGFVLGGVGGMLTGLVKAAFGVRGPGGLRGLMRSKIPFGPFMLLGALLGLLFGESLLRSLVG